MTTQISLMTSRQVEEKCVKDPLWSSAQLLRMDALLHRLSGDLAEANAKILSVGMGLAEIRDSIDDDHLDDADPTNAQL